MKNLTILPADTYTVVNKTIIKVIDRKIITMLYQPIIGYTATSLYFTLIDDLDKHEINSDTLTHHHLMATMQLRLEDVTIARRKLEAVGLIKTLIKEGNVNDYIYLVYSPLTPSDFLNHPILNVVLYNNLGKKEYDKIVDYFKIPKLNIKDFNDITCDFNDVFSSVSGNVFIENIDIAKNNTNKLKVEQGIDFNLLITSIPKNMINEKCFTEDIKELINNLSFIYNIDDLSMQGLVRNCINEKGTIDKNQLRKDCRNFYQFEEEGKLPTLIYSTQPEYLKTPVGDNSKWAKMVYTFENATPYDYLRSKYKTGEPSIRDLKLIESLLLDLQLKPGVVNVLIAYVLKINNQKLNKNYVETIAGQWKRLNIETVEEAMRVSEKEHKKMKKKLSEKETPRVFNNKRQTEEVLPDWFNKEITTKEITEEEKEEMQKILKDIA